MSHHRPKRASEVEDIGSQSKPTRASRIAQPIRRPSMRELSLERGTSLDRLNVYMPPGSTLKSGKKSTATPRRTPIRSSALAEGGSIEVLRTAEKEKHTDKKWIQAQAIKIQEYLHNIEFELGGDFSARAGLKSMSTKQFIIILNHFFKMIVGNRMSIGKNYVDDIAKILSQIAYPYTINKSWLKTPTAPHAFNNVVILLSWLHQFAIEEDVLPDFEDHLQPAGDFPDKEFAKMYMRRIEEGFILWNNSKDDEVEILTKDLINEMIRKETNLNGIDAINNEINVINKELDKLHKNRIVITREEEFLTLDKEVKMKEKFITDLEQQFNKNEKQISQLSEFLESKDKVLIDIRKRICDLKEIEKNQEISIDGRDQLIKKYNYLRQCLESKKKLTTQLQEMGTNNQIQLSRLISQKIEIITKFNNYLYKIFSEPHTGSVGNVNEFLLDQNLDDDLENKFNRIISLIEDGVKRNKEESKMYSNQIEELERKLKMDAYTYDTILQEKRCDVMKRYTELQKSIEDINFQIINEEELGNKQLESYAEFLQQLIEVNKVKNEEILQKRSEIIKAEERNKIMLDRMVEKGNEVVKEKEEVTNKIYAAVESFSKTMDDVLQQLKDIPDDYSYLEK